MDKKALGKKVGDVFNCDKKNRREREIFHRHTSVLVKSESPTTV